MYIIFLLIIYCLLCILGHVIGLYRRISCKFPLVFTPFFQPYNHRHFRILEDHVDWLTAVRDDGLITAHKLSKAKEKTQLLVFLNRCMEE